MNVTEVKVKLVQGRDDKLRGFCSVTFENALVVHDVRIIEGAKGVFVAMPSRKLMDRCSRCGGKNHLRAVHCNDCGAKMDGGRAPRGPDGRVKLHTDVVHPINARSREALQRQILVAYQTELERSKLPGYRPVELIEGDDGFEMGAESSATA
ncbi:MAG: septation protein SpoVG family protein [Planctomycetes bacterium]|nr:septation protein SpoVG family protein [Planctomycetota bacterium]